jgi:hypothetical protein
MTKSAASCESEEDLEGRSGSRNHARRKSRSAAYFQILTTIASRITSLIMAASRLRERLERSSTFYMRD